MVSNDRVAGITNAAPAPASALAVMIWIGPPKISGATHPLVAAESNETNSLVSASGRG